MEYRKLIKFGNSSHIISLPNKWLKKNKLKKGDLIYFEENGNGELVLNYQTKKEEHKLRDTTIYINNKEISTIEREIMNAYINNYDIINIVGDLKKFRKDIELILKNLLVLEVMEQTPNKIVVKDFLNLNDVSITDNIRRIDLTVRSMMADLKEGINESLDNFDTISYSDNNVNKIRFLLYRVINKALKNNNPGILHEASSFMDLLNHRLVINNLEDIADECKRVARFLRTAKIKKNEKYEIKKIYSDIEKSYLNVMKAYYSHNKQLSHEIASKKDEIIGACKNLYKRCDNKSVGVILEKLKGIESFIRNIARIVIDTENTSNK